MNIHALLSMQQGQPNTTASAGRSGDAQANGFLQAFSQASNTSLSHSAQAASGQAKSGGGSVSLQQVADQLQALGLSEEQLQQADMQALMEQIRQQPALMNALKSLVSSAELNETFTTSPQQTSTAALDEDLTEVSRRLSMLTSFETQKPLNSQDSEGNLTTLLRSLENLGINRLSSEALLDTVTGSSNTPLSDEQQQLAQTLASALERLDTNQLPQAEALTALLNAVSEGTRTPLSDEQQQLAQTLASALEHSDTQQQASPTEHSSVLTEQLAALLSGVAALQDSSAHITTAAPNTSTASSASTLFSPSLAAIRASAQASDATSQSEAANRALSLLDGTSANNTSRISGDALLAALSSTNQSSPVPNFELPAALQASLNGAGSSAAALQNSASGLSQGASQGSIATPVSSPAWPQQLGQQLVQFAQRGGEQHVQLQLHPAELGPLSISLKMSDQGTQAHFLSAHAQVRQVIEQAIPQLREALAEQGISLAETSVGEQRQQNGDSELADGGGAAGQAGNMLEGDGEDISEAPLPSRTVAIDGRVDLYA